MIYIDAIHIIGERKCAKRRIVRISDRQTLEDLTDDPVYDS